MRRFRRRRRRAAALALLPIALITTQSSFAGPAERAAEIDASAKTVAIGDSVTLRGTFPGAVNAPRRHSYRPTGGGAWAGRRPREDRRRAAATRSQVEPRQNGFWRAELADRRAQAAPAEPAATRRRRRLRHRRAKVIVRSKTTTHVKGRDALLGKPVTIAGTVAPAGAERRVVIRVGSDQETVKAGRDGRFELDWKAPATGTYPVRVAARANAIAAGSTDRAGKVTAFRSAAAS